MTKVWLELKKSEYTNDNIETAEDVSRWLKMIGLPYDIRWDDDENRFEKCYEGTGTLLADDGFWINVSGILESKGK